MYLYICKGETSGKGDDKGTTSECFCKDSNNNKNNLNSVNFRL